MRLLLPFLVLVANFLCPSLAQAADDWPIRPIAELPPHIAFKDECTRMYVDYAAEKDGSVPIYVVNAGKEPEKFTPEHWYPVREMQREDGSWIRCDRLPDFVCGNVSVWKTIPPGMFLARIEPLHSKKGEIRKVRFSHWGTSNEGNAIVDLEEVEAARYDFNALQTAPVDELKLVALRKGIVPEGSYVMAMLRLGERAHEPRAAEALKQVATQAKLTVDKSAYTLAINRLLDPMSQGGPVHWDFVKAEWDSAKAPWSAIALELMLQSKQSPERKLALTEAEMARPKSAAFAVALRGYCDLAPLAKVFPRLQAIIRDPKYSAEFRGAARLEYERMAELHASPPGGGQKTAPQQKVR